MNQNRKEKLKNHFREMTNRDPQPNEEGNLEADVGLCIKVCMDEIDELEKRIEKLESKIII